IIAYALHRTKLHPSITFAALVLLRRLKVRFPTARGLSAFQLFISTFMLMSKVICNDTYLKWELNVDPSTLSEFESTIRKDFPGMGPFPIYTLPLMKQSTPPSSANPFAPLDPHTPHHPSSTVCVHSATFAFHPPNIPEASLS
ncbi:hypothetical protein BKA82DRAFT_170662, partial [Pisolithus tinctorius]